MNKYPKIQSAYKRYLDGPHKGKFIIGEWTDPVFEYLKDLTWVWKEKVDGTNIRVQYWANVETSTMFQTVPRIEIKGKTDKAKRSEPLYSSVEKMFPVEWFQEHFDPGVDVCLYGEGYGAKIQKGGGNYRLDQSFVLFDIKIGNWWLEFHNVIVIAARGGIEYIPTISDRSLESAIYDIKEGMVSSWGNFNMEGLVGQPLIPLNMRNGQRVITKIKTKDFV